MDLSHQRIVNMYHDPKNIQGDPVWEQRKEYKIIIVDIAAFFTLENPWYWLKKYFDVDLISLERVYRKRTFRNEYEAIYRDIISLKKKLKRDPLIIIEEAFKEIPFILGAESVVRLLNATGSILGVLGGAHEMIIRRLSTELGFNMDFYDYIRIIRDEKGSYHILGDLLYILNNREHKIRGLYGRTKIYEMFKNIVDVYNVDPADIMIIARDNFFRDILDKVGLSVVFNPIGEEFIEYVKSIGSYIITGHMGELENFLKNVLII